jgi:hypothetical protein
MVKIKAIMSHAGVPLNLYQSLQVSPLVKSKTTLLHELEQVTKPLLSRPSCDTAGQALAWLRGNQQALLNQFGLCAWTYAICQQQPPLSWNHCVLLVEEALVKVLVPKNNLLNERVSMFAQAQPYAQAAACALPVNKTHAWAVALDLWQKFHLALMAGCGGTDPNGATMSRYVIRQTPDVNPFFGRTICMPTLTPARLTERSYTSQAECELALSQLPPQMGAVPVLDQVYCNEFGCYTDVDWGRAPAYNAEPATSGYCSGTPCGEGGYPVPTPSQPNYPAQQYQFYF